MSGISEEERRNGRTNVFVTRAITRAGVVAALYVALSFAVLPVASGAIQFRPSEALCVLPLFFPETIPALFIGCMLSNLITGCAVWDIIFGSVITLIATALTFLSGRLIKNVAAQIAVGGLFPVLLNAFLLPLIWYYCYGELEYVYVLQVLFLIISQSVSVYLLGTFCYFGVKRLRDKGVKEFL